MEALLLIFGEIIFALLAPLFILVFDVIGAILASIFSFLPFRRREPTPASGAPRKFLIVLLVAAITIICALFIVNRFYFAESVRMVFGTLEQRAGIETECAEISGSVFSGRIALEDCTIARRGHPSSDFQLALDRVDFDIRLGSLFGTAEIETAHVSGLRGSVTRHEAAASEDAVEKPRRAFVIEDLLIEDVEVSLSGINKDGGRFELPIRVDRATSAPLRSRLALFDILFRSNASGEIAGAEFEISTSGNNGGRETAWRASSVPVAKFGAVAGGVLSWFHDGTVDMRVEDRWRRDGQLEIDMNWSLVFRDVLVRPPDGSGVMTRLATRPIVDYVNSHDGTFPFEFSMVISESQFEYQSSLAAAGLWTAVGEAVNKVLAAFGFDVGGSPEDTGEKLKDGAKSVLDRLRKPKDEDE